jgi:NAD(P)-dependent dehydrogenase (short-subunit alcohol dehydrogenase family)
MREQSTDMSRVFLITGSSRRLGRRIADAALERGHQVVATARSIHTLTPLVERWGNCVTPVPLDVTDFAAAEGAVQAALDAYGHLDVVVNNAGYADLGSVEDTPIASIRAQLDTNFFGVVNVSKAAIPILRTQGFGHIIQISSLGGRIANAGLSAYQSAKFAVGGFSEALSQELAPFGVKVTVLEPGGMRTDWAGSSMTIPPISEPYARTVGPLARLFREQTDFAIGDPGKVAAALLTVVDMDQPPLRLLLGSDALAYAATASAALAENDTRWRALSASTDRDDTAADDQDPLRVRSV